MRQLTLDKRNIWVVGLKITYSQTGKMPIQTVKNKEKQELNLSSRLLPCEMMNKVILGDSHDLQFVKKLKNSKEIKELLICQPVIIKPFYSWKLNLFIVAEYI